VTGFDTSIRYAPDVVMAARSRDDVSRAVAHAAGEGVPLSILGTGHGTPGDVTGGVLLTTEGLASVEVDVQGRAARVGAGTTWAQVLEAVTPHGLAPLCGSAPGVGVVGYLLGGGIGPLARTYGFSADHVRSIEIVTPARGAVTATSQEYADLFWALRGGKCGFGVVTAVTIDLVPLPHVYGGGLYLPGDAAGDVLTAVAEWAPRLPQSSTASLALLRLPPLPAVPEPLRGKLVVHVRFASTAEPAEAEALLEPIRGLATPLVDTMAPLPYSRIGEVHGDPVAPLPVMCGAVTLSALDGHVVDGILEVAGPQREIAMAMVELRCLGGALAQETGTADAVGGRDAAWNLFATAAPVAGLGQDLKRAQVRSVLDSAGSRRAPVGLVNFLGRANDSSDLDDCWTPKQRRRLEAIRAVEDPESIIAWGSVSREG
jgi:hypothetical protein